MFCPAGTMRQLNASQEQEPVSPNMHEKLASPPAVNSPAEEEKREHLDNHHYPYASWCPVCIGSKGRHRSHSKLKDKDTDLVPEVSWDFNTYSIGRIETINGIDRQTGSAICFQFPQRLTIRGFRRKFMRSLSFLADPPLLSFKLTTMKDWVRFLIKFRFCVAKKVWLPSERILGDMNTRPMAQPKVLIIMWQDMLH